jgi:hypothetical protein
METGHRPGTNRDAVPPLRCYRHGSITTILSRCLLAGSRGASGCWPRTSSAERSAMGKLFVQMSVSVDGFIEDPAGGMDWFAGDARFDELLTSTLRGIDGIIFGRRAHELGAAYWPTAGETAETAEVADQIALMNSLPFRRRAGGAAGTRLRRGRRAAAHPIPGGARRRHPAIRRRRPAPRADAAPNPELRGWPDRKSVRGG